MKPTFKVPELMDVEVPINSGFKHGDIFTIAGHKRTAAGYVQTNCKPGEESSWRAVVVDGNKSPIYRALAKA